MKNEFPSLTTDYGAEVVLRSVQVQGRLDGLLLSMALRQTFRNDTDENIEVTYTFPLAWGAVLLSLEATMGGKRMRGQVMARQEARKQYEDAVEKGDAPIMVEKAQGGVFSASLGSVKPGEEVVIDLSYAQLLAFEQGRIRLLVPTTIAPRYGDAKAQGGVQPDQLAEPDLLAEHSFGLSVTLAGPVAQARIASPTHPISQQRGKDGGQDTVTISLQRQAWLDRDFVLLLEGLEGQSFAIAGPDPRSGEGHAALIASYCPPLPAAQSEGVSKLPTPLCLKLLVDCSGSMAGESIEQAREALRQLVGNLELKDRASFSRFGSSVQRVVRATACTTDSRLVLLRAIGETQANLGGTEMAEALNDTFSLPMQDTREGEEADVLIITDGEVWDAQNIVDQARRSGHRVYALGVGSAPAESLLREMAEATGGACEFVTPNEDMAKATRRLLMRIRNTSPVETSLGLKAAPIWTSALPRRLAIGETVHAFLRLPCPVDQAPTLQVSGSEPLPAILTTRSDDIVARLVAAREISSLTDKKQAKALAEKYQLVTEETNLLLVFERAEDEKTDGMPALHQVRPMLAAGWGGTSRTGDLPQVLYSRRQAYSDLSVPSVWRTNRTQSAAKVDALASGGLDDFEIPAFLRKQADDGVWPSPAPETSTKQPGLLARMFGRKQKAPTSPEKGTEQVGHQFDLMTASPEEILKTFNETVEEGLGFRQAMRAVTALPLETSLCQVIVDISNDVGGPLKAWACYLHWLHTHCSPGQGLSVAALALIEQQIATLDIGARQRGEERFGTFCRG